MQGKTEEKEIMNVFRAKLQEHQMLYQLLER